MTPEPDINEEARLILSELADILDPIEEASNSLPDTTTLYAAVETYIAASTDLDVLDEHALKFMRIALRAVVDLRNTKQSMLDDVLTAAIEITKE